jgi:hypothetical protein
MALRVGTVTPRYFASLTVSPAQVNANTTASQTFTVQGLTTDMLVVVNQVSPTAGVWMLGARVSAANTLQVDFQNTTGGNLTPTASQEFRVVAF